MLEHEDLIRAELRFLQAELQGLKDCQLRYFTLAVTSTGALLGLAGTFADAGLRELVVLTPLLVVLPCWLTFFDKATSITRIVGYVRNLENALLGDPTALPYVGFETALGRFRRYEDKFHFPKMNTPEVRESQSLSERKKEKGMLPRASQGLGHALRLLTLRTRHRYWMINWYTFLALSAISAASPFALGVTPSWTRGLRSIVATIAVVAVIVAGTFTFQLVMSLHHGRYAYSTMTDYWRKVLNSKDPEVVGRGA